MPTTRFIVPAWHVGQPVSHTKTLDVGGEFGNPISGITFRPDGTEMFVSSDGATVQEYELSTAWDISTASTAKTSSMGVGDDSVADVHFRPDGTKAIVAEDAPDAETDRVFEYDMSTAWDITTGSVGGSLNIESETEEPESVYLEGDGTTMFVMGQDVDKIFQYSLSTAWDPGTASLDGSFDPTSEESTPQGMAFSPDGLKLFVVGANSDRVYEYELGSRWDITGSPTQTDSHGVGSEDGNPRDLAWSSAGDQLYVLGEGSRDVYQYKLDNARHDYQTDRIRIGWNEDSDRYRRLDGLTVADVREKQLTVSFEGVFVSENSNADGTNAAELYEKIQTEARSDNASVVEPDIDASALIEGTPREEIVTAGNSPRVFEKEKGADRLRRSLQLQGRSWRDPEHEYDKDRIEDLNTLTDVL